MSVHQRRDGRWYVSWPDPTRPGKRKTKDFGRGLDAGIDGVVLVVEPSHESIVTSAKIRDLAREMQKNVWAVLNKIHSESLGARLKAELENGQIETIGVIPYDPEIFTACLEGNPIGQGQGMRQAEEILAKLQKAISKPLWS